MTFTADSPLASKVVASPSSEVGPRANGAADIRAIVIHMAEGGGTVSWLTRPDGNSSHYVVEYSGRIVQMVPEAKWAGSMNPKLTRTNDDAPYTYLGEVIRYGATALRSALGAGASDPNRYVIAVEIEGFADKGPNDDQRTALRELVADIRSRRGPLPCIGHRDQQRYKACPGKRIPWADYGGHAVATEEQMGVKVDFTGPSIGVATFPAGTKVLRVSDAATVEFGQLTTSRNVYAEGEVGGTAVWVVEWRNEAHTIRKSACTFVPKAPPVDCTEAVEAERLRVRGIRDQAVTTLGGI